MLQIDMNHYASDVLEDAMRLAQTKSLNSYSFSDCLSFLNYAWSDIYNRVAVIHDGYYGVNVKLTEKLTTLPDYVKNTIMVYSAQSPVGYDRTVYRAAGATDITAPRTYKLSGRDLYCADVDRCTVWLYYVPVCEQLFFTHHNRDPKIIDNYLNGDGIATAGHDVIRNSSYNMYTLYGMHEIGRGASTYDWQDDDGMCYESIDISIGGADFDLIDKVILRSVIPGGPTKDISALILASPRAEDVIEIAGEMVSPWKLHYISCEYPFIFVTYKNEFADNQYLSGFYDSTGRFYEYNPFAFAGTISNVEYLECHANSKTGMGVIVKDWNDTDSIGLPKIKELGWMNDTLMDCLKMPEMYRYLVARLADKLSALNESNIMGVQKELVEAKYAFEAFLDKDKASWKRITNVNPPTIADYI